MVGNSYANQGGTRIMITISESALVESLVNDAIETLEELDKQERNDFNDGQRLVNTHILRMIQGMIDKDNWKDFGLDFDVDRKYA